MYTCLMNVSKRYKLEFTMGYMYRVCILHRIITSYITSYIVIQVRYIVIQVMYIITSYIL